MLIKRLAIKKGIRFVRLDSSKCGPACHNCKSDLTQEHCNICREIFFATKRELNDRIYYAKIKYSYIYDNQEI